uniref:Death-inducer obliterator 1 n=1 Tax=Lepisosteus oculatus TaxID=7918 RepID=W5M8J1_LEPOC
MEDNERSEPSLNPESEQSQDPLDVSSQASTVEEKEEQNDDSSEKLEEAGKSVKPTSKEFRKTWGFRRTTIAKREMPGDGDSQDSGNAPLRRSGRQSKRTDKMEEFLSTAKRGRGRRSAPVSLENSDPPSQPPTDTETASEASFDGTAEAKASGDSADAKGSPDRDQSSQKNRKGGSGTEDSSSDDDDDNELTLKELQNQLRKKRTEGEAGMETEPVKTDDIGETPTPEPSSKEPSSSPGNGAGRDATSPVNKTKSGVKNAGDKGPSSSKSENEGYDPNALYCICRQKHNNRFMICCDRCEEWFHGNCVGITEARGRLLERNGEDYICPNCTVKQGQSSDSSKEGKQVVPKPDQTSSTEQTATPEGTEKPTEDQGIKGRIEKATNPSGKKKIKIFQPAVDASTLPTCIGPGCTNQALPDSVYCGNDCILRHAAAAMKTLTDVKEPKPKEKPKLKAQKKTPSKTPAKAQKRPVPEQKTEKKTSEVAAKTEEGSSNSEGEQAEQEPVVPSWSSDHNYNAVKPEKTAAISSTVFYKASYGLKLDNLNAAAKENEDDESKKESSAPRKRSSSPPAPSKGSKKAPASGGVSAKAKKPPPSPGSASGSLKKLPKPSKSNTASKKPSSAPAAPAPGQPAAAAKAPAGYSAPPGPQVPSRPPPPPPSAPQPQPNNQIRQNIRRSLTEILYKRVSDSDDLEKSESEVGKIAFSIEKEMFSLFLNTDNKYKNKYRTIMFNLKDPKNKGLFYRVIGGELSPFKLVRLSPEELQSREISEWKEKDPSGVLEPSQKSQREAQKFGLKQENVPDVDMEESPPMSDGDEQEEPRPAPVKSSLPVPDIFSSMLKDTTSEHRAHLFDLNCKICTGQMSAEEEPAPKKPKTAPSAAVKKAEVKVKPEPRPSKVGAAGDGPAPAAASAAPSEAAPGGETPIVESPASPEETSNPATSSQSFAPIPIPAVSSVTITRRDPRTAGYRPAAGASPAPTAAPAAPGSTEAGAAAAASVAGESAPEAAKPAVPLPPPAPKSILMKPASSPDTRYMATSSSADSVAESRSPPDGETTAFLCKQEILWKGFINMHTVAKFVTKAYLVSGSFEHITEDLPDTIHIGGRISPHTVWDYVGKLKTSLSKELCLIRFQPATEEEEVAYISLFSYFSSRGRFGVVANNNRRIKDLYLIPLSSKDPIPSKLLPFEGPGLEPSRPNLLLGLVICQKMKRSGVPSEGEKGYEEKKPKVQVRDEEDASVPKLPLLPKPEIKQEKIHLYNPELAISTTPPGSPPPLNSSESSSNLLGNSSVLSLLSSVKASTSAPAGMDSSSSPSTTAASGTSSSTPLQHILKTLFGKKKPDSASSSPLDQGSVEHAVPSAPLLDPIVQQFGQISKDKVIEEDEDDRPYDPEEEYDPGMGYGTETPTVADKVFEANKQVEASDTDDVAYDPEDETIFEEAKVVVSDFPSRALETKTKQDNETLGLRGDPSSLTEQQKMLEELNKQIEEQKRQLEEQEEALRQQRAAVGVSMAHFSVSDALMSPPTKSLLANSQLLQLGKKVEDLVAKTPVAQVINQRRDPRQSRDPRQAAANPTESQNQPEPEIEPESTEVSIPLLGEKIEPDMEDSSQEESLSAPKGKPTRDPKAEIESDPFTTWPNSASILRPENTLNLETHKILLSTPDQAHTMPPASDLAPPMGMPTTEFRNPQELATSVPFQPQSGPAELQGESDHSQFRDHMVPYPPFQDQWGGSPQQFDGSQGPPTAHAMGLRGPLPFQPMGQRGPHPQVFEGPRGPMPPQQMGQRGPMPGQFIEGHGGPSHSYDGPHEPIQQQFSGPRGPVPHFMGTVPGQFDNRGPHPSQFHGPRGPPASHQFVEHGLQKPLLETPRGHEEQQYDNGSSYLQGMDQHQAQTPPHMFRENQTPSPAPFMGQRSTLHKQFEGPRGSRPPPSGVDMGGQRFNSPNQFGGPRAPSPLLHQNQRMSSPQQRGPFDDHRGPHPSQFQGQRGPPPSQFGGLRGPPPSHFTDNGGPQRFRFEDQHHLVDGRPLRHPRPLLPTPIEGPVQGPNHSGINPDSHQDEHWQSADMRARNSNREDSETRNNGERQRERFEGGHRERDNSQVPSCLPEERQSRLSEERRKERDGGGRPWERNQGKPWSREREWDRSREKDREREKSKSEEKGKDTKTEVPKESEKPADTETQTPPDK